VAAPEKPLRIVSYNVMENQRGVDRIVNEIRDFHADFVFLQEVEKRDVEIMSRQLSDAGTPFPASAYFPSRNIEGRGSRWGNAILSKHPLYGVEEIPYPDSGSFGVWAWTMVDGRKFMIASVHLTPTSKLYSWSHWLESTQARY